MFKLLAPIGLLSEHVYRNPFHGNNCILCKMRNKKLDEDFSGLRHIHPDPDYLDMNKTHVPQRTCFFMQAVPRAIRQPLLQKYNFDEVKSLGNLLECPSKCHLLIGETPMSSLLTYESPDATKNHVIWMVGNDTFRLGVEYGPSYNMCLNKHTHVFRSSVFAFHCEFPEDFLSMLLKPGHRSLQELLLGLPGSTCDSNVTVDPSQTFFGYEV